MAQAVYVESANGAPEFLGFIIALPALMPAWRVILSTWQLLSQQNLHPLFKILGVALEVAAIFYVLYLLFKYLPTFVTVTCFVAYIAYTYGLLVHGWGADPIWSSGAAAVAGLIAFFIAKKFSIAARADRVVA